MSTELPSLQTEEHMDYLDSARGIAAMMVMGGHYLNWIYADKLWAKLMSCVLNASDAVSFFFVLSGFVLSYKYIVLDKPLDIRKYYVNRLFRLWPAFFITIVLNVLNVMYRNNIMDNNWAHLPSFEAWKFWKEALLPWGQSNTYSPGWTLVIELSASFFIPFVIVLAKKDVRYVYWLMLVAFLGGPSQGYYFHIHFIAGVLISCFFYQITGERFRHTKWYKYRYLILLLAFVLFSVRPLERIWHLPQSSVDITTFLGISFFHCTGIAAFAFIIIMLSDNMIKKILSSRILLFIGKISYGIYLMHWLLVCDIFLFWGRITPYFGSEHKAFVVVFVLYTLATLLLATIIHYAVELPFIRLGKRITGKMRPSLQVR